MTWDYINQLNESYEKKPMQKALRRVLLKNDLADLFGKQEQRPLTQFKFSHEIKTLPITNQQRSGRCWLFAGLNFLREVIAKKYNVKEFEFSQNYTAFWDKFEKINYFIEAMDDFLDADNDNRTLKHLLRTGIQDGGQWDMFVSLVEKYGVVPKEAMVETSSSSSTRKMNQMINIKLRQYAAKARALYANGKKDEIRALKDKTLDELYTFLTTNFGVPPKKFDFEYVADEKYHIIKDLTPQQFYQEHAGNILKDYVSIINAPTKDKPFLKTYTVQYLGNVVGGQPIKYLNLKMKDLKALVLKQLLNDEVVWFGSDVAQFGERDSGVWDDESYDYDELLEMNLQLTKEESLDYSQSAMNHAMVITGVNLDEGQANRWKIQNSWGEKSGTKGYFLCSDTWFDKFVYQAVIHKNYLTDEQKQAWELVPIELKPWDPMGSLAK